MDTPAYVCSVLIFFDLRELQRYGKEYNKQNASDDDRKNIEGTVEEFYFYEDGYRTGNDQAQDRSICRSRMLFQQPFDQLCYEKDTKQNTNTEGNQDLAGLKYLINIEIFQGVNEILYGADDLEIVTEDHHDHGTADTGDDHGSGCDHAHQEEHHDGKETDVMGLILRSGH